MGDFDLIDHGSLYILVPLSSAAVDWCEAHLPADAMRWGQVGYVLEPRYVSDIVDAVREAGLMVKPQ